MSDKTVDAFVIRDFTDAGDNSRFKAGDVVAISEGRFGNFEAAGLVRTTTAEEAKPKKAPA